MSGKKVKSLFETIGFVIVPGQGKGSHFKLRRKGSPMVIVPNHKELKKGMERALLKQLEKEKK